ncbi:cysteine desulfurase family protein [Phenylobacterium montanum]|uniref:Cysteine desulfurase n=1 Tax=Phenylobacterium montanum TaxID=2823693 RepID=A0A975IV33_9CAUL|nr:cysteine desulfurase family protein [Caulobacter sp. S6]QUD88154.1 cysteine desulfurase [Caulobacter sp. S6]
MTAPNRIYLDYNATAPIRPEAAEAVACALAIGGNPSSVHAAGRTARAAVERARGEVARLVACKEGSVTFTSGGTEANALAIDSAIAAGFRRPIVGLAEHASTLATCMANGDMAEGWGVRASGIMDLDWLEQRLKTWPKEAGRPFVALSLANNETGVIQPVAEIAALVRAADGWLHVDAVQAAGKIALDFAATGADTLSLSAHKLGGPQGVGALIAGPRAVLSRRLHGGGQERGRRAGTENVSGIAGFGAAARAALRDLPDFAAQAAWRDAAQDSLAEADGVQVFGTEAPRLPSVLSFAAESFESERQVIAMDLEGIMVSAGAACSSGKVTASPVLQAMGFGSLASTALRVSGGWATTEQDWTRFAEVWLTVYDRFRARRRASAA